MSEFDYSGGALCLDFANTWGDRSDLGNDKLTGYHDLLGWAHGAGVVSDRERGELEKLAHTSFVTPCFACVPRWPQGRSLRIGWWRP